MEFFRVHISVGQTNLHCPLCVGPLDREERDVLRYGALLV